MFTRFQAARLAAVAASIVAASPMALAESGSGCTAPQPLPDGNTVVFCRHLTIEIEKGADFTLGGGAKREPTTAALRSGAVYVDDQSNAGRSPFQIRTPDAIAAVRGTRWAVDVGARQSSVFVVEGAVAVRRRLDGQTVSLTAGEGVDVAPERTPLTVKHWAPARADALLARFGR